MKTQQLSRALPRFPLSSCPVAWDFSQVHVVSTTITGRKRLPPKTQNSQESSKGIDDGQVLKKNFLQHVAQVLQGAPLTFCGCFLFNFYLYDMQFTRTMLASLNKGMRYKLRLCHYLQVQGSSTPDPHRSSFWCLPSVHVVPFRLNPQPQQFISFPNTLNTRDKMKINSSVGQDKLGR